MARGTGCLPGRLPAWPVPAHRLQACVNSCGLTALGVPGGRLPVPGCPLSSRWLPPVLPRRFELYRKYLADLLERDSEAGVILTDSRDVLIQSDPWEHPLVQQLVDEVGAARPCTPLRRARGDAHAAPWQRQQPMSQLAGSVP